MALTYRSPVEEVLTSFTSSEQSEIARDAVQNLKGLESHNHSLFCYAMPAVAKMRLSESGIYLSPFSYSPHSHPVCKTLENYHLYNVVCPLLDHSFYLVGVKDSKLNFLKSRNKSIDMVTCINRLVTSRDKIRYGNDFVVASGSSGSARRLNGRVEFHAALKDLLPKEIVQRQRALFMHDELHYWSPECLAEFLDKAKPKLLLATVVIPPELLLHSKESMNRWCYEYEVHGNDLHFFPDGVRSESYIQPLDCTYLLKTSKLYTKSGLCYCFDIISSKFSHHVIAITQGEAIVKACNSFSGFEAIGTTYAKKIDPSGLPCYPISYTTVIKLYTYLASLNSPDMKSAVAKLRQLVVEPTAFEVKFAQEFANMYIKHGVDFKLFLPNTWKEFKARIRNIMPLLLVRKYKHLVRASFTDFVHNLCPLSFHVDCEFLDFRVRGVRAHVESTFRGYLCAEEEKPCYDEIPIDSNEREPEPYTGGQLESYDLLMEVEGIVVTILSHCEELTAFAYSSVQQVLEGFSTFARPLFYRLMCMLPEDMFDACLLKALKLQSMLERERLKASGMYLTFVDPEEEGPRTTVPQLSTPAEPEDVRVGAELPSEPGRVAIQEFHCVCCTTIQYATAYCTDLLELPLADQLNGRRAGFYSQGCFNYTYNGGKHAGNPWVEGLDLFLKINGHEMDYYNCVLIQKYEEGASLGLHRDDEELFVENGKILTVNICGTCDFRFKCAYGECGLLLDGPQQFIMPEGFQVSHKHGVRNCSGGRMSATFRRAKEVVGAGEAHSSGKFDEGSSDDATSEDEGPIEETSNLGVQCLTTRGADLTPYDRINVSGERNMCFWNCLSFYLNVDAEFLKDSLLDKVQLELEAGVTHEVVKQLGAGKMAENECIQFACYIFKLSVKVVSVDLNCTFYFTSAEPRLNLTLIHEHNHFQIAVFKNDCFVEAVAQTFGQSKEVMYRVLANGKFQRITDMLSLGDGLDLDELCESFELLNIKAHVLEDGEYKLINPKGEINGYYQLVKGHIVATPPPSKQFLASRTSLVRKEASAGKAFRIISSAGTQVNYVYSVERAKTLDQSLLRGCTGVISSELFSGARSLLSHEATPTSREVTIMLGTFGAGKTSLIKRAVNQLKGSGSLMHFVLPRKVLAQNLRHALGLVKEVNEGTGKHAKDSKDKHKRASHPREVGIYTFEIFLKKARKVKSKDLIVIDEVQLYPPGYLDLVLALSPPETKVLLIGDPCQSDYDSENDRHVFLPMANDISVLTDGLEYKYNKMSRRFRNKMYCGRLPCSFRTEEFTIDEPFAFLQGLEASSELLAEFSDVYLVSSFIEKNFVRAIIGEDVNVLTFGESTGLTFSKGTIFITESSLKATETRWLTALSRFALNLAFVNMLDCTPEQLASRMQDRALGAFLLKKASLDDIGKHLKGKPKFTDDFLATFGKNQGVREAKLAGDPWLKSNVFLGQTEDFEDVELSEVLEQTELFKTHLPRCELEGMRSRWSERIILKEAREFKFRDMVTEQFTDSHAKQKGQILTNQAERYESIYPRHRASDTLTFLMAVKKRLRFSKPHLECAKLKEAEPYGAFLLKKFLAKIPLRSQGRPDLMAKALFDFEEKKLSKSAATIENHSGRSCSDWLMDVGLVFSKGQICTKWDNRFRVAKAAQSIVCFQHSVLCRFAPYMRYIEMKVMEVLPCNYYIHSGKGLEELNQWVIGGNFSGVCTESDYEAFDASQDHYIMAFELALMRYLGLPKDLINDYIYIKTHLGCKMGAFAIMRFSGEASTFLFNTLANMLFTFLRYDIRGDEFICFAGDDMCASKRLRVSAEHEGFLSKLRLKAKVDFTARPTFCGWNLTPFGIYKKPQLVMERICIAKETNNLKNCIDNYAIEVSFAYRKGELAVNHMNEEELEAFYNCVRVIIKNKHIMKSDVRLLFENAGIC
nr:replicase [Garlic yellow virus]